MFDETRSEPPFDAVPVLAALPVGIFITDAAGRIIWVNSALCDQFDSGREALIGLERTALPARKTLSLSKTVEWLHRPGAAERRFECILQTPNGSSATVGCVIEVSRHEGFRQPRQSYSELKDPGKLDAVTGLLNYTTMQQELVSQVSRSRRYHNPLALVLMRLLDDAAHGEQVTDIQKQRLAKGIARMLKDKLRWVDVIGCWDKDAFLLILPETGLDPATKLVRKIENHLEKLKQEEERAGGIAFRVVVGLAEWRKGDDVNALMGRIEASCRDRNAEPPCRPDMVCPSPAAG